MTRIISIPLFDYPSGNLKDLYKKIGNITIPEIADEPEPDIVFLVLLEKGIDTEYLVNIMQVVLNDGGKAETTITSDKLDEIHREGELDAVLWKISVST